MKQVFTEIRASQDGALMPQLSDVVDSIMNSLLGYAACQLGDRILPELERPTGINDGHVTPTQPNSKTRSVALFSPPSPPALPCC